MVQEDVPKFCSVTYVRQTNDPQSTTSALFRKYRQFAVKEICFAILAVACVLAESTRSHRHSHEPCYDSGTPRICAPEFDNVALKRKVKVSETCGVPNREEYCHLIERNGRVVRECDACERTGPKSHPASSLTDIHDIGNLTYWQSKTLYHSRKDVKLTMSFGKQFELAYISVEFYSSKPATMAIYKSMNHGRTWEPYQYYANECRKSFRLPSKVMANVTNEREVLCTNYEHLPKVPGRERVVYNPTKGRPSEDTFERSYILQDWVTATDIRFVLDPVTSGSMTRKERATSALRKRLASSGSKGSSSPVVYSPSTVENRLPFGPSEFYAISDISIGGTCKCNGHASRCLTRNGKLVCDCRHNTDGDNCDKCKPFHFDRPWKRATHDNANECIACKCNLHAKRCRFNAELFQKSGGQSGGVCHRCRHHTTGRHCHVCKQGYYRNNKTKSFADRKACKPCACHPVGAAGKICNPLTGQCPCKDGVTGKRCNRCSKGYEQTRSVVAPCVRIRVMPTPPPPRCSATCNFHSIDLSLRKVCKMDFAIEVKVKETREGTRNAHITLAIKRVYRSGDVKLRRGLVDVVVRKRVMSCMCPKLRSKEKFLLLGKYDRSTDEPRLSIDKSTIAIPWGKSFKWKIRRLAKRARKRGC